MKAPASKPVATAEEFLDPAAFPDELSWVPAHYKLHPTDPVYLLIAWHWRRVKQSEDTLAAAIVEMRTMLDARVNSLAQTAETISGVNEGLASVQAALEEKPAQWSEQLEEMLGKPVRTALERLHAFEKALAPVARSFETSQRRQSLAVFLTGLTLGVLSAVIVLLA
ncbi:hypothetical protein [Oleiharenicola lentus]|uniref:hypothetical protein n=1 Tax=Oleiharenicola lentus TaxID=2508720 RepID=UPI003F66EA00